MNQTPDTIEVEDTELLRLIERNAAVERSLPGSDSAKAPFGTRRCLSLLQRHAERHPPPMERGPRRRRVRNPSNNATA